MSAQFEPKHFRKIAGRLASIEGQLKELKGMLPEQQGDSKYELVHIPERQSNRDRNRWFR